MSYHSFENLEVWKRSRHLAAAVYSSLKDCRDFGLKDQMQRSAVSIASNIAEGAERGSNAEFCRFLRIAKGSSAELRTQYYIAQDLKLLGTEESDKQIKECKEISSMLQGLIALIEQS